MRILSDPIGYASWRAMSEDDRKQTVFDAVRLEDALANAGMYWDALMNIRESEWGVLEPWLPDTYAAQLDDAIDKLDQFKQAGQPVYESLVNTLQTIVNDMVEAGKLTQQQWDQIQVQQNQRRGLGDFGITFFIAAVVAVIGVTWVLAAYYPSWKRSATDADVLKAQQAAALEVGRIAAAHYQTALDKYNDWLLSQGKPPVTGAIGSIIPNPGATRSDENSGFNSGAAVGVIATVGLVGFAIWGVSKLSKGNK